MLNQPRQGRGRVRGSVPQPGVFTGNGGGNSARSEKWGCYSTHSIHGFDAYVHTMRLRKPGTVDLEGLH